MIEARLHLPDELVERIAARAAEIVLGRMGEQRCPVGSPYLTVPEAAEYLRCSRQRVYDLLSAGRLRRWKDGSRVLVARDELEAYLSGGLPSRRGGP